MGITVLTLFLLLLRERGWSPAPVWGPSQGTQVPPRSPHPVPAGPLRVPGASSRAAPAWAPLSRACSPCQGPAPAQASLSLPGHVPAPCGLLLGLQGHLHPCGLPWPSPWFSLEATGASQLLPLLLPCRSVCRAAFLCQVLTLLCSRSNYSCSRPFCLLKPMIPRCPNHLCWAGPWLSQIHAGVGSVETGEASGSQKPPL